MIDNQKVKDLVQQWLQDKDYFLTDLVINEDDRIVVEIDHKDGVWIDDCVALSKFIEAHLDRDTEDYELEVGSAGIRQPFKVLQQYLNNVGNEVEVLTCGGVKMSGVLKEADDEGFTVVVKKKVKPEGAKRPKLVDEDMRFAYSEVKVVKAVIKF